MTDKQKMVSWWQTIPGFLTALAAIISAIAALVLALHQVGFFEKEDKPASTSKPTRTIKPPPKSEESSTVPRSVDGAPALDETARATLAGARALVRKRGPSQEVAQMFIDALRGGTYYTIVVRDNCDSFTIRNALFTVPTSELIVLPLPGTDCYRVGWGIFSSPTEASITRDRIADKLRQPDSAVDGRVEPVAAASR